MYLAFPSLNDQPAGVRVRRRGFSPGPFGRVLGHFFAFVRNLFALFSHFARIFNQLGFFNRFVLFFIDLGWIWGGFGEGFGRFFR